MWTYAYSRLEGLDLVFWARKEMNIKIRASLRSGREETNPLIHVMCLDILNGYVAG
jgi:hypothetical protein